ncbi:SSWI/SNF chromatin-remodeling complex subunit [Wickerhamomyces ciferrii]|uniref:SSWI/SNF chromatin-remodeling complex subunit n=1 Tax=Wickerhamomyces ciferrii (strain ATCC 14091 / BCRC 22168 / CBS 111 / JCM 3599 / NBRC 0793 / NRRL Y-1031 F-60-10) TaxID=1206466 RepID=K0KC40_WICCF|nr:SSWI/SNF chromatin-remodeling complex subunit [Wickerhamomyces ciferrii]CCH42645.1 SSWI/SNF chromatin-remodeling complex subunit [Wickerhamomyces ciferrii]
MFPSISKAWNEVSDESNNVKLNDHKPSKRNTTHYIHHDKPSSLLQRVKRHERVPTGSPRILKESANDNKQNSLWGSAMKNISKVFKKEDEIQSMQNYMNDMIGKPRVTTSVSSSGKEVDAHGDIETSLSRRRRSNNVVDNIDDSISSNGSRRPRRTDVIADRIEELTSSSLNRKRRRLERSMDTSGMDSTQRNSSIRSFELPTNFNRDLDIGSDTKNQYQNRHPTTNFVDPSWKSISQVPAQATPSSSNKIIMTKITARELPSSPFVPFKESTPKPTHPLNNESKIDNTIINKGSTDKILIDSSRIDELYAKVQQLETTVQGLSEELKAVKSQSTEPKESKESKEPVEPIDHTQPSNDSSFDDTISPVKPNIGPKELIFDNNISRPLSPVKLDLDKFKIIK